MNKSSDDLKPGYRLDYAKAKPNRFAREMARTVPKAAHGKHPKTRTRPMLAKSDLTSVLSGIAGEYFVAAELTRRGYVATITLRNTAGIDILASNMDASKSAGIQVKTKKGQKGEWVLGEKAEHVSGRNLFYVFVRLNHLDNPEYYVVPSTDTRRYVRKRRRKFLATVKSDGSPHRETTMRKFSDPEGVYKDRWDLLGLD